MTDVTALARVTKATPQAPLVSGYVSKSKAAPTAFGGSLYVILPTLSTTFNYGPCKWGALQGATLPVQGTSVLVAFDSANTPFVVWWDGIRTSLPATAKDPGDQILVGTTAVDVFASNTNRAAMGFRNYHLTAIEFVAIGATATTSSFPVLPMTSWPPYGIQIPTSARISVISDTANTPTRRWEI